MRVRWVLVVLLVLRPWCLWRSLVFAGGRSGRCVPSGSGCILYYFANLGKIGSARTHAPTYAPTYARTYAQ